MNSSTLYYLIEAGQLARFTLQRPLQEMGIYSGDDAIILALKGKKHLSDKQLCARTGLTAHTLQLRINRLISLSLINRNFSGSDNLADTNLTKKGRKLRKNLVAQWHQLQEALMDDLNAEEKKILRKTLKRFSNLLLL
ncbi:MAG: MarR family winged helix-turn-helix transcriptional regulator [Devosiaceae bacterium]|nr:MarR family winged helix-turn-helix transcriptional regulator [Devosiaceae bacterium]